jgi:hypothetical protein
MDKLKIHELVSEIRKTLETSAWFTPLNLSGERDKFLSSRNYNPKFRYSDIPRAKLRDYFNQLNRIKVAPEDEKFEDRILRRKVKETLLKLQLILSRGKVDLSHVSLELYQCDFDNKTLDLAKKDALIKGKFESKESMTPPEIVKGIQEYLKNYGIKSWQVQLTDETDLYIRILRIQFL